MGYVLTRTPELGSLGVVTARSMISLISPEGELALERKAEIAKASLRAQHEERMADLKSRTESALEAQLKAETVLTAKLQADIDRQMKLLTVSPDAIFAPAAPLPVRAGIFGDSMLPLLIGAGVLAVVLMRK